MCIRDSIIGVVHEKDFYLGRLRKDTTLEDLVKPTLYTCLLYTSPEHLLYALASQEQGLIPQLLQKLNVYPGSFSAAVAEKLSALPRRCV